MTNFLHTAFPPWNHTPARGVWQHSITLSPPPSFPIPERVIAAYATLQFSAKSDRWSSWPVKYSGTAFSQSGLTELHDESDFEKLASSNNGLFSICGFGSLLSERSARSTFPDLINFRVARLNGFRRVFAHVTPIFFERGIAKPETMEISGLSVEPCEGESLVVTVFEIHRSEIPSYIKREIEYRFLAVFPETLDGTPFTSPAVLCARYSDEEFLQIRCKVIRIRLMPIINQLPYFPSARISSFLRKYYMGEMELIIPIDKDFIFSAPVMNLQHSDLGNKEMFFEQYGRYNIHKIWRDDVLPCRVYLRHCLLAAKSLSDAAYNDFLDHTFLADRKTTVREYLATTGSGIMEEEPPESLKFRYGG